MRRRFASGLSLALLSATGVVTWVAAAPMNVPQAAAPAIHVVLGFDASEEPPPESTPPASAPRGRLGFEALPPVPVVPSSPAPVPSPQPPAAPARSVPSPVAVPGAGGSATVDAAPRVWFQGDTLLWWIKDSRLPPLVTTSPQSSLGVLGAPGTRVLFGGDTDNEARTGGRFRLGVWFDDDHSWGFEPSFFFLGQRAVDFQAASQGAPLLARPFFNGRTGAEDAEQVANLGVPSLPSLLPLTGRVSISSTSRLWGLEANGVRALYTDDDDDFSLILLGGFRYLRLDEGLAVGEDLLVPAWSPAAAGMGFHLQDDFSTRNHFYGGQLGARGELRLDRWSLDLLGKVALGVSQESVGIKGATQITAPGAAPENFAGALLALPTNIGRGTRDRFAVVPECGATVGYQLTPHVRATLGYTFLYWSDVARPGNEINRVLNPTQLPPGSLRGPAQPTFQIQGTDFWAMGVNFGLGFEY